jgi:hypothetical protein
MNPAESPDAMIREKFIRIEQPSQDMRDLGMVHQGKQPFPMLIGSERTGTYGMPVAYASQAVFTPTVSTGSSLIVIEILPSLSGRAIVLPYSSPRPFA